MKDKDIINFAKFYERYRYNNSYILLTDHKFLLIYKQQFKKQN
jgi:hypothetical protein